MRARKRRSVAALAGAAAAAYILLFPLPMEKELVFTPAWALDTSGPPSPLPGAPARPFRSGGRVGYYDPAGSLLYSEPVLYGASTSATTFVNYSRLPGSLVFKDARGAFVAAVAAEGYPVLDETGDRALIVSRDAKGLTEIDRSGEVHWRVEFASIITSLALSESGVLTGLLDGTLALHDRQGRPLYTLKPAGSRVPVILGCAIRDDAIAAVAGIDPQRLVVVARHEGHFQPSVDIALESSFRREVLLRFSRAQDALFFQTRDGLGLLDLRSRKVRTVAMPGAVRSLAEMSGRKLWAALHDGGRQGPGLLIYEAPVRLEAREALPSGADFLAATGRGFVVGVGGRLIAVEVRRE